LERWGALAMAYTPACSGIKDIILWTCWSVWALTAAAVVIVNLAPRTHLSRWTFAFT